MTTGPVWHGTKKESAELVNAIARNCDCTYSLNGARSHTCGGHTMLLSDQRALDGLVWMRRQAERLRREEIRE